LNGIGTARREEADVSPFDELVELPRRVRSGTHINDALGGALQFMDMLLSTDCKFCGWKLRRRGRMREK
jgi:hypothetical protein